MIVDRNAEIVLGDEPLQAVERIFRRVGRDVAVAQPLGQLEDPAVGGMVLRERVHALGGDAQVEIGHLALDGVEFSGPRVGRNVLAREFDVSEAQLFRQVDGLLDGELAERVALQAESQWVGACGASCHIGEERPSRQYRQRSAGRTRDGEKPATRKRIAHRIAPWEKTKCEALAEAVHVASSLTLRT